MLLNLPRGALMNKTINIDPKRKQRQAVESQTPQGPPLTPPQGSTYSLSLRSRLVNKWKMENKQRPIMHTQLY